MVEEQKDKRQSLVLVGAKIPAELKDKIEKKAEEEERSISKTISRLLSSHPDLDNVALAK